MHVRIGIAHADTERIPSSSVYPTGASRLIATEHPMFPNNDFSEEPKIHSVGVLPTRRPAEFYQELKSNDPAMHAMTDFTSKFAITVAADRQIDAALAYGAIERARHAGDACRQRHRSHHFLRY